MLQEEASRSRDSFQYKKPRRRRIGRIIAIVVLISLLAVLLVGGIGVGVRLLNPTPIRTTTEMHAFNIGTGAQPTLIIKNDEGFIHVQSGTGNAVSVTTTKVGDSFGASPDDFKVDYSQNGNTITVQVNNNAIHLFDFSAGSQADINVTVPVNSDLNLENNSGDISVTGIHGKLTLTSNSGSVQATGVSLQSGSQLGTDSGNVSMQGSIGTDGHYTFQSNSGNVDVTLPQSPGFQVDMETNSGSITNDFSSVTTQQPGNNKQTVRGDVGNSPQATVSLQSDSGSLHLRQQ